MSLKVMKMSNQRLFEQRSCFHMLVCMYLDQYCPSSEGISQDTLYRFNSVCISNEIKVTQSHYLFTTFNLEVKVLYYQDEGGWIAQICKAIGKVYISLYA